MTVAWFSFFPLEWMPNLPEHLRGLPRLHPATWQRTLLAELVKIPGIRLHVVVLRNHFARDESFELQGVTFHLVKTLPRMRSLSFFWHDTICIRRVLERIQPDVVHAWGTENGAALVASRLGRPALITMQGLCTWIEALFPVTAYERFVAAVERYTLRRLPTHMVVTGESTFSSTYLREHYPQLTIRRVDVVPDGMFHHVQRQPRLDPRRLVFIGELGPRKGGDTLLQALDRLRTPEAFELVVIGGAAPGFLRKLKAETSSALWERVRFKQGLSSASVAAEFSEATLMVCPTRADTGPMAVKEAVVAGVPVVASRVGGVPDYVVHRHNGLLAEPGNLESWVRTLGEAMAHPQFGAGLVDHSCLVELRKDLSPMRMAKCFVESYEMALENFKKQDERAVQRAVQRLS